MNWRLVLALSGFGAAMAILTVFVIPSNVEPLFWLANFAFCGGSGSFRASSPSSLHGS